jgi:PTS system fructose-specific IIB component/fructose-specific PTS system IIB-like component
MAAEQLKKTGKKLGHDVKVETQGAMGIEDQLSAKDIQEADAVIIACDLPVIGRERFDGKRILEVPVQEALKNAPGIFEKVLAV